MKIKKELLHELIYLSKIPLILTVICVIILSIQFIYSRIPPYWFLGFFSSIEEQQREWKNFEVKGLYKGQKIQHTFAASENNLGIVMVRFYNFGRALSDKVEFRFKESNKKDWYYKNVYKVNQFQPNAYFTFGFAPIADSKNKKYYFEVESVNGKPKDAIALSRKMPNIAYVYKFSKQDLRNKNTLLFFMANKISYSLRNINYLIVLNVYTISLISLLAYRKREWLLKQFIVYLNKLELILEKAVKKVKRRYFKKILDFQDHLFNYYKKYSNSIIVISVLVIFLTAALMRLSFYWNPLNFDNELIWSHLGGHGDYDNLFRHTVRFMVNNDITALYWGMSNDFPILIRLYSLFFKLFGFINGLNYSVYFFILLSSLICLFPFIILSKLKRFSIGGFTASMLLAVNSLSIWVASGRIIDMLTSFLFSVFVILFVLSLEKRNFILAILLGIVAVIDSHNRGLMLLNDIPALALFGLFYIYLNSKKSRTFPFIKLKFSNILYGFLPLFILMIYYAYMNVFFITVFKRYWAFGFWGALPKFDSVAPVAVKQGNTGIIHKLPIGELVNYFLVFSLGNIFEFIKVIRNEILFMIGLTAFTFFKFLDKFKKLPYKLFLIPLIYLGILYLVQKLLMIQPYFKLDLGITSLRYYLRISDTNFLLAFILLEFSILQIFFLKKDYAKYILTVLPYFPLLGYGYYASFSERHYAQILFVFYILFGLMLDKLFISNRNVKIKALEKIFIVTLVFISFGFIGGKIIQGTSTLIGDVNYFLKETKYLKYASTVIPKDGIILSGMKKENLILVSNYTQRPIIYNIGTYDSYLIKPGREYFSIPFVSGIFPPYVVNTVTKNDVVFRLILGDENEFKKYKFYILDYNISRWKELIANKRAGYPTMKAGMFDLERINTKDKERPIYKLALKQP